MTTFFVLLSTDLATEIAKYLDYDSIINFTKLDLFDIHKFYITLIYLLTGYSPSKITQDEYVINLYEFLIKKIIKTKPSKENVLKIILDSWDPILINNFILWSSELILNDPFFSQNIEKIQNLSTEQLFTNNNNDNDVLILDVCKNCNKILDNLIEHICDKTPIYNILIAQMENDDIDIVLGILKAIESLSIKNFNYFLGEAVLRIAYSDKVLYDNLSIILTRYDIRTLNCLVKPHPDQKYIDYLFDTVVTHNPSYNNLESIHDALKKTNEDYTYLYEDYISSVTWLTEKEEDIYWFIIENVNISPSILLEVFSCLEHENIDFYKLNYDIPIYILLKKLPNIYSLLKNWTDKIKSKGPIPEQIKKNIICAIEFANLNEKQKLKLKNNIN